MEILLGIIGAGISGKVLQLILKNYLPKSKFQSWKSKVAALFKGLGVTVTAGSSKLPVLKSIWNSVIEPYVILALDLLGHSAITGFIEGLKSDNKSFKDE